jgi:hypothetical protein
MTEARLTRRALNRATLARQGLLKPLAGGSTAEKVARLGSLQAQHPEWPPLALLFRTGREAPGALTAALEDRSVVRAALMRITVHVVAAEHFWPIALLTQELRRSQFRTIFKADVHDSPAGRRLLATHPAVRRALRDGPLRIRDMDAIMKAGAPSLADAPNRMQWRHFAASVPLVHVPFEGEGYGRSRYAAAEDWIGPPPADLDEAAAAVPVTERYLAAFGPASLNDLMAYVGSRGTVRRWRDALAALGDRVMTFVGEDGAELHDLREAPRPEPSVDAPPRLLARWDSLLLSHAVTARQRVIADEHRAAVYTKNADVRPTFLLDGTVAGTWERSGPLITLRPFRRLRRADREALEGEAATLVGALLPDDEPRLVVEHA